MQEEDEKDGEKLMHTGLGKDAERIQLQQYRDLNQSMSSSQFHSLHAAKGFVFQAEMNQLWVLGYFLKRGSKLVFLS